ncbi:phosphogluconate dehydratase [Chromatiales bacterium (ex Bugula neritina AB1)]|nr:phosphogluconate dehydratase [Chromatiales bacterium (ex Bugula neritina AB1)]
MTRLHATVESVTERIRSRSQTLRSEYLEQTRSTKQNQPRRNRLSCTNFAHAVAAVSSNDKLTLHQERSPNLGIVSAYNEMLSAHQPFERFPKIIKSAAREAGATAMYAGGVPAMCDGVTQGRPGMELSLFSRDVIAQATAIALSHDVFDSVVYLGTCDKIVPGLLMGALGYGHLPAIFAPAGPMTSGLPNSEKAIARQQFAEGKISRAELLKSECASYHGPGTCTFYGTANSNQMLMEILGLHLPGSAFINPGNELRDQLTHAAALRALEISAVGGEYTPVAEIVSEKSICNAIVGLLATGGSTNHTMHIIAIARCAGLLVDWTDFSDLSAVVPSLTSIYPNGEADVNQFHAAGGMAVVISQLLRGGLLHNDVKTVVGDGLERYCSDPAQTDGRLSWNPCEPQSSDTSIIANLEQPFDSTGGIALLEGNLGRAVIKTSAVKPQHRHIRAPARVFRSQGEFLDAFDSGELECDFVAVVTNQGPRANGMPELHKLTPALGILQDRGFKVALVTDGRMSGASGKVPAAIHVTPECSDGGALARIQNNDLIELNAEAGTLQAHIDTDEWKRRENTNVAAENSTDNGRHLFSNLRCCVSTAETGALTLFDPQASTS